MVYVSISKVSGAIASQVTQNTLSLQEKEICVCRQRGHAVTSREREMGPLQNTITSIHNALHSSKFPLWH